MTGWNYRDIIGEAVNLEYIDIPNPDELEYGYRFSAAFENKMKKLINKSERLKKESDIKYIHIGKRSFRKTAVLIAVIIMIMTLVACAVRLVVIWNETDNKEQGTLDVTFEVQGDVDTKNIEFIYPEVPEGFEIVKEHKSDQLLGIEYANSKGEIIIYSQCKGLENMGMSIDNDDEGFFEAEVNGHKAYARKDEKQGNFLIWSDGTFFYSIITTQPLETLFEMAEKIYE